MRRIGTILLLSLLVVSIGTAALVKYLSNTVTYDVTVTSPLEVTGDNLNINIFGGEQINYRTNTTNKASINISAYPITQLSGPANWTGTEFFDIFVSNSSGTYNITDKVYVLQDDGSLLPLNSASTNTIRLFADFSGTAAGHAYTNLYVSGGSVWYNWTITTNPAITPGTYNIKSCNLYDTSGACV